MTKKTNLLQKFIGKFASRLVIEQTTSELNPMLEVVSVGDRIILNAANTNYSYGGLHRVFQKIMKKVDIPGRQINEVLILGFGTGSVASILKEEIGLDCHILAVEKDPEVIRLGKKYFATDRFTDLDIIEADAAEYVATSRRKFDLIVVDVYVDFEVPESCETDEFVAGLEKCLKPGGMVLFNKLVYNHQLGKQAAALIEKFESLKGNTKIIKVKENIVNRVIVYEDRKLKNVQRK
jgi:spermidine synthase